MNEEYMKKMHDLLRQMDEVLAREERARKAPREGEKWSDFEKIRMVEGVEDLAKDLAMKFGRSRNSILWAIRRYVRYECK